MSEKISKIRVSGETKIIENFDANGEGERVIEKWVDIPRLEERIVEKVRQEVYERTVDHIDASGDVVDRKVESVHPVSARMQLVEHIAKAEPFEEEVPLWKKEDKKCHHHKPERVQQLVANRVADKVKKSGDWFLWTLGAIIASEAAIFVYVWCWM